MSIWTKLFGWFRSFFDEVAKTSIGKMAESLKDIALAVCAEISLENLSSEAKRAAAFERIWARAIEEGKEMSNAAVNLAIEMAVAILKSRI